jgi:hypothetical protein
MKKTTLLVAAVCVLAFSTTATAGTPAQYRTKVNGICKAGIAKINALKQPAGPKDYAAYFDANATLAYQIKQIVAVTPLVSLQPTVAAALKLQGRIADLLLQTRDDINKKHQNPSTVANRILPTANSLSKQADVYWRKAGLNACTG